MIIYNKTWLNNLHVHHQIDDAHEENCITVDEIKLVKEKYPVGFYTPGIFIRIGLFILTFIIVFFSFGLLSLMLFSGRVGDWFGWAYIFGMAVYIALEQMVRKKNHYRSGVDDALLWICCGFVVGGFVWMLSSLDSNSYHNHYIEISVFICILSLYLTLRFADTVMNAITCLAFLSIVFFTWKSIGAFGITTMPFIMMIVSGTMYILSFQLNKKTEASYYQNCLIVVQTISLIALYAAGNYYIVDELSGQINNTAIRGQIPFGWFFWIWTMVLPFTYIFKGIYNKNTILLRIGLSLIVASIVTFRNYHHILSTEAALTLGGIILIAVVYGAIKYLKSSPHGFTYTDTGKADIMDRIKVESLIIGETLGHTPNAAPAASNNKFGGGDFGGGGSGGSYQ